MLRPLLYLRSGRHPHRNLPAEWGISSAEPSRRDSVRCARPRLRTVVSETRFNTIAKKRRHAKTHTADTCKERLDGFDLPFLGLFGFREVELAEERYECFTDILYGLARSVQVPCAHRAPR